MLELIQTVVERKILIFSVIVASTTVIAGILHVLMAPRSQTHELGEGTLFLVGGFLQIFWAVPVLKRWGKIWQIIGIVGTAIFFALWLGSRLHLFSEEGLQMTGSKEHEFPRESHGNINGHDSPSGFAIRGQGVVIAGVLVPAIEFFQIAFIILYIYFSRLLRK